MLKKTFLEDSTITKWVLKAKAFGATLTLSPAAPRPPSSIRHRHLHLHIIIAIYLRVLRTCARSSVRVRPSASVPRKQ